MSYYKQLQELGINLKGKLSGQIKSVCPKCSESRKNKKDLCLSVNIEEGTFNCHHCDFKGRVKLKPKKVYTKPLPRLEKLSKNIIEYFEGRKISNNTLLSFGITEATEWMPQTKKEMPVICFNYFRDDELLNIKYRSSGKAFKMVSDAELIFYNLDKIKDCDEVVICEGEIDCLTLHECGIFNCISVPNGATKGNQNLTYLDNCFEYFEGKTRVVLMVDNDDAGNALREELARRIGKDICYQVNYGECKDINEVLVNHGKEAVKEIYNRASMYPIEGIMDMNVLTDEVIDFYDNGYPESAKIGIDYFDELLSFMGGQFTTVTGIPGSGKSEFVDMIMVKLAKLHKWKFGVCSFENQPSSLHVTKIMEKVTDKSFAFRKNPNIRMTVDERNEALVFVDEYFSFININQADVTIDGLLDKLGELVRKKGIKGCLIDPFNYIEHKIPLGYTETQYICEILGKIHAFCLKYDVHLFIIAHPIKIQKDKNTGKYEVPTLYHISGSAHWFNKTDNGLVVYRDFDTNLITAYIQKVRFSWCGKVGFCNFNYDTETRKYTYTI